jgi:DNA polymerase elongation subunit (family B)
MNKLIFGSDSTERIVNLSLKDDTIYIYKEKATGIELEKFEYTPWILSHGSLNKRSERLKGNQYWNHLTPISSTKFHNLQEKWQRDLWLPRNIEECFSLCEGFTYYKGMRVEDVSILSFDIETNGLAMNNDSEVYLISNTFRKNGETIKMLFSVDDYDTQLEMIDAWCDWVRDVNPSILTGHNILSYDLPYLDNIRMLRLGRDESYAEFAEKTSKFRKDGSQQYDYHNVKITGREIIDTFFLSIKYDLAREFPSYGLKPIIKHLGLEKADRTFIDSSKIREYRKDPAMWEKVKQYAIEDSEDSLKLFDKMVAPFFYLAQSIPKTMQQMINEASGAQLDTLMIRSYLQDGYSQPRTSMKNEFEGAISMGRPGVYEHVAKADVASLYPSIMLEYNIHDSEKDPNNHMIKLLTYFRDQRLENKKLAKTTGERYYDDLQNAQKIMINSMYGFLGAGFLLYNYPKGASQVTSRGREILLKAVEWATGHTLEKVVKDIANEGTEDEEISHEWVVGSRTSAGRGYTLVNVDTDSFSITNGTKLSRDDFAQELNHLNALYSQLIRWEDDGIYEKVIVIRAKNYVLVKNGKIKIKGSAITDQKKEPALAEMLKKMVDALLTNSAATLPTIYETYIKEAMNIKDISRWSTKKTVTKSVLQPTRLTEQKILNAIHGTIDAGIVEGIQEGDKIWLYNAIDGQKQDIRKGEKIYYRDGSPKMIDNCILKDRRLWNEDEDVMHYINRVYDTVFILANVINIDEFMRYGLKSNRDKLKDLTQKETYGRITEKQDYGFASRLN